jgi:hypothetical protein
MDLSEVGCEVTEWIQMTQLRDQCRILISAMTFSIAEDLVDLLLYWY